MIGIYKITSPSNKIYIGQSLDILKRFKEYKRLKCKEQIRLYNSFYKYGVLNHKFEIIETTEIFELNTKERYYQDLYNCIGVNGLNCRLTTTNDKSGKMNKITKNKMSISKLGNQYRTKKVINILNKKIYNSVKEAYLDSKYSYSGFVKCLNGTRINNTNFRYIKNEQQ